MIKDLDLPERVFPVIISNEKALELIVKRLSRTVSWDKATCEFIADTCREAGYVVRDGSPQDAFEHICKQKGWTDATINLVMKAFIQGQGEGRLANLVEFARDLKASK